MVRITFLITLAIAFMGILIGTGTNAFFNDSVTSTGNAFAAAETFSTTTPSETTTPTTTVTITPSTSPAVSPSITPSVIPTVQPGDIVINEVNPVGNSDVEWIEVFNKSSNPVDITGWILSDVESSDTIPTTSPIPAGGFAIIRGSGSSVIVPGSAITITLSSAIGNALNANNEAISLKFPNNTVIDALNWGSNLDFFNPSISSIGLDTGETFSRNPNGQDTNTAADWIIDGSPSIGVAN